MKALSRIFVALVAVLLTACGGSDARKALRAEVEASNRACPVSLGASGRLVSVTYDPDINVVTMNYLMNEHYMQPEALDEATPEQRRAMAEYLQGDEGRSFLYLLDRADASLALSFVIGSAEPKVINLPAREIHAMAAEIETIDAAKRTLAEMAAERNESCPFPLPFGLRADTVTVQDKYHTYIATAPDTLVLATSEQMRRLRLQLLDNFKENAAASNLTDELAKAHYGLRYLIHTADSATTTIDLTPAEIAAP